MSVSLLSCKSKEASLCLLAFFLLLTAGQAKAMVAASADECDRLGETRVMDSNANNIVACLHRDGMGSPKIWKNYFPTDCNEGDVAVYKDGLIVCEKLNPVGILRNYTIDQLETANYVGVGLAGFLLKTKANPLNIYSKTYVAKTTGKLRIEMTVPGGYKHPIPYDHTIADTFWNSPVYLSILANGVSVPVPGATASLNRELFNPARSSGSSFGLTTKHVGVMPIVKGQSYVIRAGIYTLGNAGVNPNKGTHQVRAGGPNGSIEFMEYTD